MSPNNLNLLSRAATATKNDWDELLSELKKHFVDVSVLNMQDAEGNTLLHYAARVRNMTAIQLLTSRKVNLNIQNALGNTPLHEVYIPIATANDLYVHETNGSTISDPLANILESAGAISTLKNNAGETRSTIRNRFLLYSIDYRQHALCLAIMDDDKTVVEECVKIPESINGLVRTRLIQKINGNNLTLAYPTTALHVAAYEGKTEFVNILVENGALLFSVDGLNRVPLYYAVANGNLDLVKLLVEKLFESSVEEIKYVLKIPEKSDENDFATSPFALAERNKSLYPEIAAYLNQVKQQVNGKTNTPEQLQAAANNLNLLSRAATATKNDWDELLSELKRHFVDVSVLNMQDAEGNTLLHYAARVRNMTAIQLLTSRKVDLNIQNALGNTPLHEVYIPIATANDLHAYERNVSTISDPLANILESAGAISTLKNNAGETRSTIRNRFLLYSIPINSDYRQHTLCLAIRDDDKTVVEECVKIPESINGLVRTGLIQKINGNNLTLAYPTTALHVAAYEGKTEFVNILVENGALLFSVDGLSRVPLYYAVASGNLDLVKLLVEKLFESSVEEIKYVLKIPEKSDENDFATSPFALAERNKSLYPEIAAYLNQVKQQVNGKTNTPEQLQAAANNLNLLSRAATATKNDWDELLSELKRHFVDVSVLNMQDAEGNTLLHYAARVRNMTAIQLLTSRKVDLNIQNALGNTPLHEVYIPIATANDLHAYERNVSTISDPLANILESAGAISTLKNNAGETRSTIRNRFLLYSIPINSDYRQHTLCLAIRDDDKTVVEECVKIPESINGLVRTGLIQKINGNNLTLAYPTTALHVAAYEGKTEFVNILVENGALLFSVDGLNRVPLYYAVASGNLDLVKLLVEKLFESSVEEIKYVLKIPEKSDENDFATSPFALAERNKSLYPEIAAYLNQVKQQVNGKPNTPEQLQAAANNLNLLSRAATATKNDWDKFFSDLKRNFVDVSVLNMQDVEGNTLLHYAARARNMTAIQKLVRRKVDLNIQNALGNTPLHEIYIPRETTNLQDETSISPTSDQLANTLESAGAITTHKNKAGETRSTIRNRFLLHSQTANSGDGEHALYLAIMDDDKALVEKYVKALKNINKPVRAKLAQKINRYNLVLAQPTTALHVAAYEGKAEFVNILMENGALPVSVDGLDRVPLYYAVASGNLDSVKLLVEKLSASSMEEMKFLLKILGNPDTNDFAKSPFALAEKNKNTHPKIVEYLTQMRQQLNEKLSELEQRQAAVNKELADNQQKSSELKMKFHNAIRKNNWQVAENLLQQDNIVNLDLGMVRPDDLSTWIRRFYLNTQPDQCKKLKILFETRLDEKMRSGILEELLDKMEFKNANKIANHGVRLTCTPAGAWRHLHNVDNSANDTLWSNLTNICGGSDVVLVRALSLGTIGFMLANICYKRGVTLENEGAIYQLSTSKPPLVNKHDLSQLKKVAPDLAKYLNDLKTIRELKEELEKYKKHLMKVEDKPESKKRTHAKETLDDVIKLQSTLDSKDPASLVTFGEAFAVVNEKLSKIESPIWKNIQRIWKQITNPGWRREREEHVGNQGFWKSHREVFLDRVKERLDRPVGRKKK